MKNENADGHECNPAEKRFLGRLREHPELLARFQSILELTDHTEGPLQTAAVVVDLLIQELRVLGHASMHHYATQAEARVSAELKAQDATVRSRKKKRGRGGVSLAW